MGSDAPDLSQLGPPWLMSQRPRLPEQQSRVGLADGCPAGEPAAAVDTSRAGFSGGSARPGGQAPGGRDSEAPVCRRAPCSRSLLDTLSRGGELSHINEQALIRH